MKILQHRDVLSIVLAGGMGERLFPLTRDRAKPAVPFGGRYRIIDFVLNNFVNSGLTKIKVLTQFKSNSLIEHIIRTWRLTFDIGQFVDPVPAQMRRGPHWFRGTADAVYQNLDLIFDEEPEHVCVFGGDHIYMMDVNPMLAFHEEGGPRPDDRRDPRADRRGARASASSRSTTNGRDRRLRGEAEGAAARSRRSPTSRSPRWATTSSAPSVLIEALEHDALQDTTHDFGKTIIPALLKGGARLFAYDFSTNRVPGEEDLAPYWRDVGTVDSYWDASMDLISVTPPLNLYNPKWPIKSHAPQLPPAKFVFADAVSQRIGLATDSMVASGCIISGGTIHRSILFPRVRVNSFSHIEECVLMDGVDVGRYARLRRVIVDKGVQIPRESRDRLRRGGGPQPLPRLRRRRRRPAEGDRDPAEPPEPGRDIRLIRPVSPNKIRVATRKARILYGRDRSPDPRHPPAGREDLAGPDRGDRRPDDAVRERADQEAGDAGLHPPLHGSSRPAAPRHAARRPRRRQLEHPRFERPFLEEIESLLDVQECYAISGEFGYRLKVRARDVDAPRADPQGEGSRRSGASSGPASSSPSPSRRTRRSCRWSKEPEAQGRPPAVSFRPPPTPK